MEKLVTVNAVIEKLWDFYNRQINNADKYDPEETKAIRRSFSYLQNEITHMQAVPEAEIRNEAITDFANEIKNHIDTYGEEYVAKNAPKDSFCEISKREIDNLATKVKNEREEYLTRYQAVMKKMSPLDLLSLPEQAKELLKNTTSLKTKVQLLEKIAEQKALVEELEYEPEL